MIRLVVEQHWNNQISKTRITEVLLILQTLKRLSFQIFQSPAGGSPKTQHLAPQTQHQLTGPTILQWSSMKTRSKMQIIGMATPSNWKELILSKRLKKTHSRPLLTRPLERCPKKLVKNRLMMLGELLI